MLYQLSSRYQLQEYAYLKKRLTKLELAEFEEKDSFVLVKDERRIFIISKDIYHFLEFLKRPRTREDLEKKFVDLDWYPFFKNVLKKGVLVEATRNQKVQFQKKPKPRFSKGNTIDGYKITKQLAFRNYTQTCIATKGNNKVVIKALSLSPALSAKKTAKLIAEFQQEFEVMQKLPANPYFAKLQSFYPREKYAILQFIQGKTIDKVIYKKKIWGKTKERIILQITEAMSFLHSHQIVHGDLHHLNVMISKSHKVTLLDLGMSHEELKKKKSIIKMGGLDAYLPPERINRSSFRTVIRPANYQSDIYQLGILMYFILFKEFPFTGITWDALHDNIKQGDIDFSRQRLNSISKKYLPIIKKCLSKNPKKRFKNALELKRRLVGEKSA